MAYEALTIPGWSTLDNAAPLRWLEFTYTGMDEAYDRAGAGGRVGQRACGVTGGVGHRHGSSAAAVHLGRPLPDSVAAVARSGLPAARAAPARCRRPSAAGPGQWAQQHIHARTAARLGGRAAGRSGPPSAGGEREGEEGVGGRWSVE